MQVFKKEHDHSTKYLWVFFWGGLFCFNHLSPALNFIMEFQGLICLLVYFGQHSSFSTSQCRLFNGGIKAHSLIHLPLTVLLMLDAATLCHSD